MYVDSWLNRLWLETKLPFNRKNFAKLDNFKGERVQFCPLIRTCVDRQAGRRARELIIQNKREQASYQAPREKQS